MLVPSNGGHIIGRSDNRLSGRNGVDTKLAAMISFFAPFGLVTLLTLFGRMGSSPSEYQRNELLPLLNFELFVYLLFLVTGLSILFAFRSRLSSWFATFFNIPAAGALSGWGFGLTLAMLFRGDWVSVLTGLAITAFVTGFCLSPVILTRLSTQLAQDALGKLFPKRHQVLAVYGIGTYFSVAGAVGLWRLYGG